MPSKSPNRYFNNYIFGPTQKLMEDLIIESIRMHGLYVRYLPRNKVNLDLIFGESSMSTFEDAILIEAYVKNPDAFEGQRIMTQFGSEIREETIFTISKKRFEEIRAEHLLVEIDQSLEQEKTNRNHAGQFNGILLEEGNIEGYYIEYDRPREGDLIWIQQTNRLFEITYVQHDAIFFQGGALQTYDLSCQLFEYSSEEFNTGEPAIDSIEDLFNGDLNKKTILEEDDDENIHLEDGGNAIQEGLDPENNDPQANNNVYRTEAEEIIDWTEVSPFVQKDYKYRW